MTPSLAASPQVCAVRTQGRTACLAQSGTQEIFVDIRRGTSGWAAVRAHPGLAQRGRDAGQLRGEAGRLRG